MSDKQKELLTKISKKIFIFLLISFTAIYLSEATGYYEVANYKKRVMTEENIKKFEKDVKEGKNIDLKNYIKDDKKSYESKVSKFGNAMSNEIEKYVVGGLNNTFKFLNNIME